MHLWARTAGDGKDDRRPLSAPYSPGLELLSLTDLWTA